MKLWVTVIGICLTLLVGCGNSETQPNGTSTVEETVMDETEALTITPDLKGVPEGAGWNGTTQTASLTEKDGAPAVQFTRLDWNLVWLDEFEFDNGIIEFDAKGKSEPPQGSFIGVAFRVVDDAIYDAVYFRPFNFQATDEVRKLHAVQYISSPLWGWERLRTEKPGQYEMPIDPAPDGDTWFHAKIIVEGRQISVFVNNATEPSLQVTEISNRSGGSVGIWCYGYGVISNLQITPMS